MKKIMFLLIILMLLAGCAGQNKGYAFSSDEIENYYEASKELVYKNQYEKASFLLNTGLSNDYENIPARLLLAEIYAVHLDNKNKALQELDTILEIDPYNGMAIELKKILLEDQEEQGQGINEQAMLHFQKAEQLFAAYHYQESIPEYKKAIEIEPEFEQAHLYLGDAYYMTYDFNNAIKHYLKAIEINPNNKHSHHYLGDAYLEIGELEKALESYIQAVALDPEYVTVRQKIAMVELMINSSD